jgi:hypothetical protein
MTCLGAYLMMWIYVPMKAFFMLYISCQYKVEFNLSIHILQVYSLQQGRRDVETVLTMGIMEDVNIVPQAAPGGNILKISILAHYS